MYYAVMIHGVDKSTQRLPAELAMEHVFCPTWMDTGKCPSLSDGLICEEGHHPNRRMNSKKKPSTRLCTNVFTDGKRVGNARCKFGKKCRFIHRLDVSDTLRRINPPCCAKKVAVETVQKLKLSSSSECLDTDPVSSAVVAEVFKLVPSSSPVHSDQDDSLSVCSDDDDEFEVESEENLNENIVCVLPPGILSFLDDTDVFTS